MNVKYTPISTETEEYSVAEQGFSTMQEAFEYIMETQPAPQGKAEFEPSEFFIRFFETDEKTQRDVYLVGVSKSPQVKAPCPLLIGTLEFSAKRQEMLAGWKKSHEIQYDRLREFVKHFDSLK